MSEKLQTEVLSIQSELIRSRDYADTTQFPTNYLETIGTYWSNEMSADHRSERSKQEIEVLLGRVCFEIAMREREVEQLDKLYGEGEG